MFWLRHVPPPTDESKPPLRCRCGAVLEDLIPQSLVDAGFTALCGPDCTPAPGNGAIRNLPTSYRDRT